METEDNNQKDSKLIVCSSCKIKKAVTWRCKECDIVLCVRCKKDHIGYDKVASPDHSMVPLMSMKELKSREHVKYCKDHTNEVFQMYCQTCDCPICLDCITSGHNQHQYVKVHDIVVIKQKENFELMKEVKEIRMKKLADSLEQLQNDRKIYADQVNKTIVEVECQFEALNRNLNEIRMGVISELREKEKQDLEKLHHLEREIEKELQDLKNIVQNNDEKLFKLNEFDMIDFVNKMQKKLENFQEMNFKDIKPPVFMTSDQNKASLKKIFGCVDYKDKSNVSIAIDNNDVAIVSNFEMKNKDIRNICPIGKNQAWINFYGSGDLVLVSSEGEIVKSIQKDFYISDIAVLATSEILAADEIGLKIKKLSKDGKFTNFLDTSPFSPHGLHINNEEEILASLRSENDSKVIRFSKNGIIQQTIQLNKDKSLLFNLPSRLTETLDGDIWVLEGNDKSLVIVDKDGRRKFCYKGPPGVRMFNTFNPFCTQLDEEGHIFVSDYANDIVYMVNQDGHLLKHILTKWQHGIMRPDAIGYDKWDKQLWISGMHGKIYIVKYQS